MKDNKKVKISFSQAVGDILYNLKFQLTTLLFGMSTVMLLSMWIFTLICSKSFVIYYFSGFIFSLFMTIVLMPFSTVESNNSYDFIETIVRK